MASFPTLSTGAIATYPLARTVSAATVVHRFEDDSEQRYRDRVILHEFELNFESISFDDWSLIRVFFEARRGSFEPWDITVDGTLYSDCIFVDDSLTRTEDKPNRVSGSVKVRQIKGS